MVRFCFILQLNECETAAASAAAAQAAVYTQHMLLAHNGLTERHIFHFLYIHLPRFQHCCTTPDRVIKAARTPRYALPFTCRNFYNLVPHSCGKCSNDFLLLVPRLAPLCPQLPVLLLGNLCLSWPIL